MSGACSKVRDLRKPLILFRRRVSDRRAARLEKKASTASSHYTDVRKTTEEELIEEFLGKLEDPPLAPPPSSFTEGLAIMYSEFDAKPYLSLHMHVNLEF